MSFVTCLKQAHALTEQDRATLHEMAGANRAAGMTPTAAAAKAVSEYAQTVKAQRAQADAVYEQSKAEPAKPVEKKKSAPLATFNPKTLTIALTKQANLTSFLHESGHYYLEVLSRIARQEGAPQQMRDDWSKLLNWFGVSDQKWAEWQAEYAATEMVPDDMRAVHERFAESIEQFFFEGKAPSVELQPVFHRIRAWFNKYYESVRDFLARRGVVEPGDGKLAQTPAQMPPFFSALSREIEKSPANTAPASGWKATLKGLVSNGKIKADEVAWSGIEEWLALQPGKVTKQQVSQYLAGNGVKISETILSDETAGGEMVTDTGEMQVIEHGPQSPPRFTQWQLPGGTNPREIALTLPVIEGEPMYRVPGAHAMGEGADVNRVVHIRLNDRTDADGNRVLFVEEVQSDWGQEGKKKGFKQNVDKATLEKELEAVRLAQEANAIGSPEYERAVTREGEITQQLNSAEHGGAVPTAPFVGKTDAWVALAVKRVIKMAVDESSPGNEAWSRVTEPQRVREKFEQYFGPELASVLPLEVVDTAMLGATENDQVRRAVVEAIPVDVVNILAGHGISPEQLVSKPDMVGKSLPAVSRPAVARGLADALALVGARSRAVLRGVLADRVAGGDSKLDTAIRARDFEPDVVVRLLSSPSRSEPSASRGGVVAPAASRGTEARKAGLDGAGEGRKLSSAQLAEALNRHDAILRGNEGHAVAKYIAPSGYEKIAFITGDQSAERYDLSKQIESIDWSTIGKTTGKEIRRLNINPKDGSSIKVGVRASDGEIITGPQEFVGKQLDEVVGKDIAKHIVETPDDALRGLGLKMGGEGMKAFYDKIVPSVVKDVLRKVGGEGMGTVDLHDVRFKVTQDKNGTWGYEDDAGGGESGFSTREQAQAAAGADNAKETGRAGDQPGFTITDQMRERAAGGLPLFQGGPSQASQIQLNDEIRGVFNRLFATDEQIRQAEEIAGMLPDEKATEAAIDELAAKSLQDMKWLSGAKSKYLKALQAEAKTARKEVIAEVTAEVNEYPQVKAKEALDAAEAAHEADPVSADFNAQVIADTFGFDSIDAMHQAIEQFGDKNAAIKELVDQRMLEQHGELIDPQAMEDAANAAIHNQMRARVLASELKAQTDALGAREQVGIGRAGQRLTVNTMMRAAKLFAQNVIAKTKIGELRKVERDHLQAERRAATRWEQSTKKADTLGAVRAKKDQTLNNAVVMEAVDARAEAQKIATFFKRVLKGSPEKVVRGGRDVDVVNAMREVLAAYGYTQRTARTAADYMEIVRQHDPALAAYLQPGIDAAMRGAKPVSELTMTELRVLHDQMQTMWNKAQRSKQMEVAGKLIAMDDAEDAILARAAEIKAPPRPGETSALTVKDQIATFIQGAGSLMRRVEPWAEGMDGKWGGPFLRYIFHPVKHAADKYRDSRVEMQKRYQALIDDVAPFMTGEMIAATRDGEINYTFGAGINGIGHSELLHAILHTGNASNKRKLLLGRKWAVENPDGSLDTSRWDRTIARLQEDGTLRKEHYDFAQNVWDMLESMKGPAQDAHRTVYGYYFEEIKADEVVTPFGTYRGGYVPAQADPRLVDSQAMKELATTENENMNFVMPTTGRGFAMARVEYNVKLMLDLQTLSQHIDKVLKFTHMQPAISDVNRLLQRNAVSEAINAIDPTIIPGMIAPWLSRSARQIVEEPIAGDFGISRGVSFLRNNAGVALLAGNASNALQQVTGFSNAMAKLKADGLEHHMMRAVAQFVSSPSAVKATVAANSPFMAHRMENEVAAILDSTKKILLNAGLYTKTKMWVREHAFFMQAAMDNAIGPIVWTAAYNAMLQKTGSMADASTYADGVVRQTQGSSLPEDISRSETGNAYMRILNQFTSYWNMMSNASATQLKQTAEELGMRRGAGKMLMIVTLGTLVPIWVAEAIAQAMRGGPDDPDGDKWLHGWIAAVFGFGTARGMFAMIPGVGPTMNSAINRMNDKPYDDNIKLSPVVSMVESTVKAPFSLYKAIVDGGSSQTAIRDSAAAMTLFTGLPFSTLARPIGYAAGVAEDKIAPTGPVDFARGMVTGTASPESKQ